MLYAFQIKSCISEKNLKFFILQKVDTSREFEWKDLILTELLLVKCIFCQWLLVKMAVYHYPEYF